jgi:hypothetical protein
LFLISQHQTPSKKQLRSFGFILAGGFLVVALLPVIFRHHGATRWAVAVSFISAVAAIFVPASLRQVYRVWMTAGDLLGWINSKVILGVVYYILMSPLRLLMTLAGHDPMNRKFDRKSATYRVVRKPRSASHMAHQF